MNKAPRRIGVVIPYYQRERGILERAVKSALAQDLPDDVILKFIVVDDDSPVSAEAELIEIDIPEPHAALIVHQANGGPGSARNRALDYLDPQETPFVAFLDSDDEWLRGHLRAALDALGDSHDFYFCDHTRDFDTCLSWFEDSELMQDWLTGKRQPALKPVADTDEFFWMTSTMAVDAFLREYLSHTSTVVYRFDRHPRLRFDSALRSAGEDYMFWLALASDSRSVVFSTSRNIACGQGVNVYFSSFDWGNPKAASRHGYRMLLRIKIMRNFRLTRPQAALIGSHLKGDAQIYAYLLVRNALQGRVPDWSVLASLARVSLGHVLRLPIYLLPMLAKRHRNAMTGKW